MFDTKLDHKKYFFPPIFHPCHTPCYNYFDRSSGSNTYFFFPLTGSFAFILKHSFALMHFLRKNGLANIVLSGKYRIGLHRKNTFKSSIINNE